MMRAFLRNLALTIACASVAAAHASAQKVAPSFDCRHVVTAVEGAICAHPELARQDLDLARLFKEVSEKVPANTRKSLFTERARWRATRNACADAPAMTTCISDQYRSFGERLRSFLPAGSAMSASATATPAPAAPPASGAPAAQTGLSFLEPMVGKDPFDAKLFENPQMKARLAKLMGADAKLVAERFQTSGTLNREGSTIFVTGNKAHAGGSDDGLIVADVARDEMWVWLTVRGKLRRFGPKDDPARLPEDAAAALKNMPLDQNL